MRKLVTLGGIFAAAVSISAVSSAATDGKNRKILVENLSSHTLRELYASPTTATTWEEDLLGQRTLKPGQKITANIDNGTNECSYDLKAVLDDGRAFEQRRVNVCASSKWIIGESGNEVH